MPRYVILEHRMPQSTGRGLHWDLMFEVDDALRAWALDSLPLNDNEVEADALVDHRLHYLDYEGPISGDRGEVRRWDWGAYEWVVETADAVTARLNGKQCRGQVRLWRVAADQRWRVSFVAEESDAV